MGNSGRSPRDPAAEGGRRHCWVMSTARERGPWPGLILEWRRTSVGDWQARVVYVPNPRDTSTIEQWFAAALLRPVDEAAAQEAI